MSLIIQQYDLYQDWEGVTKQLAEVFLGQGSERKEKKYVASDATYSIKPRADDPRNWSFDLLVDPGEANENDLAELYEAFSELHRAYGGVGLIFRNDESHIYSPDLKTA